ncbi:MAG: choice-of-anchor L domain-containing protein [Saprospiraceae bacterium]
MNDLVNRTTVLRWCGINVFLFVFLGLQAQQMEVTGADVPPYSPENLIRDVFLGNGVEVLDIQYDGNEAAVGYFSNGNNSIGIDRGLILTTGVASKVTGVGQDGAQDNNDLNQQYRNEIDLEQIAAGAPLRNVAKYTIRFIPTSDTLQFRYVFASEEYPEFVCSEFNDVFGFFISGPGFNGPFENGGENIAKIPGTNLPVAINYVNNGQIGVWGDLVNCTLPLGTLTYAGLFNDNQDSQVQPVFDGFTYVFTAEAVVQPCQEYVIKLAIADVTDEGYDSGVFLEAKSFGTTQLLVEAQTTSSDGAIAEGCAEGLLTFTLSRPLTQDYDVTYNIMGDAQNGVDYEFLSGQLTIPAGETTRSIIVRPIEDFTPESLETIIVEVQKDRCSKDTVTIFIKDNELDAPILGDTLICPGESVQLDGQLPVQVEGPKSFSNTTALPIIPAMAAVKSDIVVSGVYPFVFRTGVIESVCLNIQHNNPEDLDIYLIAPNGKFIALTTDNGVGGTNYTNTCFTEVAGMSIDDALAQAPYSGSFLPEGVWTDLWSEPCPTNGTWSLLLYDDEFGANGVLRDWTITFKPPYELYYEWTPDQDIDCSDCPRITATPPASTTYTLTVMDSYGCGAADSSLVEISEFPLAPAVTCGSETTNSVTFEWAGIADAQFYEYSVNGGPWMTLNPEDTTLFIGNLGLGENVDLDIRTISNCPGEPASFSCQTLNCVAPDLNVVDSSLVRCSGENNASIQFEAIGLANQYTYTVNNQSNNTGEFTNLAAGNYELTVTDDLGCASTLTFEILEPEPLLIEETNVTDALCAGATDGTATLTISGGTSPYSYSWPNNSSGPVSNSLPAGMHTVTVTDDNGCLILVPFEIDEPAPLSFLPEPGKVSCAGIADAVAGVNGTGGTGTYSYQWDMAAGSQITRQAVNLSGGSYSVTITDENGCQTSQIVNVVENDSIDVFPVVAPVSCFNGNDGAVSLQIQGGAGNYSFQWSNNTILQNATNLAAGSYNVTVTDEDNCDFITTIQIDQPDALEYSYQTENTLCHDSQDGMAQLEIQGGTPGYAVRWQDGNQSLIRNDLGADSYNVTISDANNCETSALVAIQSPPALEANAQALDPKCFNEASGQISINASGGTGLHTYTWSHDPNVQTASVSNLTNGFYAVTITDENNCTEVVSLALDAPDSLSLDAEVSAVKCHGLRDGNIMIEPEGGVGGYQYSWTGPNGFTSLAANLINIPAGDYAVEITDANGCKTQKELTIDEPEELTALMEVIPVSCANRQDGEIFIQPEGGTAPYKVEMDGFSYGVVQNIGNLRAGEYSVVVIDDNGCTFDIEGLIVGEAKLLTVELGEDKIIKLGETVDLIPDIQSDFTVQKYEWAPGNPDLLSCLDCPITTVTTEFQVNVKLTITDEKGCKAEDRVSIFVEKDRNVFVPTGFTPNGDGNNDNLLVHGKDGDHVKEMRIYDRWGELVFLARDFAVNDEYAGWDGTFRGKQMTSGVYIWYLEVSYEDGLDASFKGSTTLIR